MRTIIAAPAVIFALAISAEAQTWSGPGAQPVAYSTHQLGDGSTPSGGTPPAALTAPAEITTSGSNNGEVTSGSTLVNSAANADLKWRTECEAGHENDEDPILFRGIAAASHRHTWVGSANGGKDSDYSSLRGSGASSCAGGKYFTQDYWEPSLCKAPTGSQWQCLKPDFALFYYTRPHSELGQLTALPPGSNVIFGNNTTAAFKAARLAEQPSGYQGAEYQGVVGWSCVNALPGGDVTIANVDGTDNYPTLETPTHGDPWAGNCKAGYALIVNLTAPECWDGKNRTSPNGRDQFRFGLKISANQAGNTICPDNWYKVPDLQVRFRYTLKKDAEYYVDQWFPSSDRMDPNPANWPIRGTTMHADWMMGADPDIWKTIMAKCLGIASSGYTAVGGDCGTYTIGDGRSLNYGNLALAPRFSGRAKNRWWPLKPGQKMTQMIHGR